MEKLHFNVKILGLVQGVNFRYYAKIKADELDIKGFVKNEPDGSVYIEAEGENDSLDRFVEWCKKGPRSAKVDRIEVKEENYRGVNDFQVQ